MAVEDTKKGNVPFDKANLAEIMLNSLTGMDAHERPLFIELRGTVVSCQIFIHSQSLIAR